MALTIDEKTDEQKKKKSLIKQSVIQVSILLGLSLIGIIFMIFLLFLLSRNLPNSPYSMELSEITNQDMINLWGLDKTPFQQFFIFLWNIISGNWGESIIYSRGNLVKDIIAGSYITSLNVNFVAFYFSLPLGLIFGFCSYFFRDKWFGQLPQVIKRLNWAIILFGLGMLLQYFFGYKLHLLPTTGFYSPQMVDIPAITHFRLLDCLLVGNLLAFWDTITHLLLPIFCLSFIMVSFITELTYSIIDIYKTPKKTHVLSGKIGFYLSFIFTSCIMLAYTFSLPGIAMLTNDAINSADIFLLSAALYCILLSFFIINFAINFLMHLIRFILEFVKISKMDDIITVTTISSESLIAEIPSNSPETISELTLVEKSIVLDKIDDKKKKKIGKEIFRRLRPKILNPLSIIGLSFIIMVLILTIFAGKLSPYDFELVQGSDFTVEAFSAPSSKHIFGVTKFGRDVLSRCLYGIQTAVKVGFISTIIGMPLGVLMGMVSAFFGKWVKYIIDTINGMSLFLSGVLFALSILSIVGNDFGNLYWILGLSILPIATLFTQQAVSYEMKKGDIQPFDFGKTNRKKILIRLPNILLSILGVGCLIMGLVILAFETLNWLGRGDLEIISLGIDINLARTRFPTAPWATLWPLFCISLTVLSFIMLGIGLKEE